MQGGPKSSTAAPIASGRREGAPDLEIFFVDLSLAAAYLEAEEKRTPRLSPPDIERAGALTDGDARHLWRASRIATRIVLERAGGARLRRVAFGIEPGGRPVLGKGDPHFSVSHTDGVALIAVANDMGVGVDLEAKNRDVRMSEDRRRRVVEAAERLGPQPALSIENDSDVLVAWVKLEAAAKALGIGIGRLLTEEGVVGTPRRQSVRGPERALSVRALSVSTDHLGAIAAPRLPDDLKVERFPYENIDAFLRSQPS